MPKPLPTDREILDAIYERYYEQFTTWTRAEPAHPEKALIAIDINAIAKDCEADPEIVFARLHYHLRHKHVVVRSNGNLVASLFYFNEIEGAPKSVHFPLLSSVLAPMRAEERKHRGDRVLAIIAIVISAVSLAIAIAG